MPSLTDDYAFMNFHFDTSLTSDAPKAIMLQNQSDHKNQHHQAASKHDMIHLGLIARISRIFPDREIPENSGKWIYFSRPVISRDVFFKFLVNVLCFEKI